MNQNQLDRMEFLQWGDLEKVARVVRNFGYRRAAEELNRSFDGGYGYSGPWTAKKVEEGLAARGWTLWSLASPPRPEGPLGFRISICG